MASGPRRIAGRGQAEPCQVRSDRRQTNPWSNLMQLLCNTCHHPIPAADINIDLGIAKCAACDGVFSFLDSLDRVAKVRPIVQRPKRFEVEEWGSELTISRGW